MSYTAFNLFSYGKLPKTKSSLRKPRNKKLNTCQSLTRTHDFLLHTCLNECIWRTLSVHSAFANPARWWATVYCQAHTGLVPIILGDSDF